MNKLTGKRTEYFGLMVGILISLFSALPARTIMGDKAFSADEIQFTLQNKRVHLTVIFKDQKLVGTKIAAQKSAKNYFRGSVPVVESDGNFALDVMWTDWQAPGKINNADNPVILTEKDFRLIKVDTLSPKEGVKILRFFMKEQGGPLNVTLSYSLAKKSFFVKKQIAVQDTVYGFHFLRRIYPLYEKITRPFRPIKKGGFGQPVVLRDSDGGVFLGLEYPASRNILIQDQKALNIVECSVEVGRKIEDQFIESGWVVIGITPPFLEKLWFSRYLQTIRVAALRPYTLYNSWYDLRSPAFPNIAKKNIMNEQNIFRIIGLIQKNFVEKNHIHLDAFVLDDGWDSYASDWQLRKKQFPHGMKPVADRLKRMNTHLGIWFGPGGGYSSARLKRVNWMKEHGYETVGKNSVGQNEMLCLAGKKYSRLFKKRVTDFVNRDGVRFFKWDGIQFSCSEPDHGHAIGIYSRRAVLDTLISMCRAVRAKHPNVFLNITSGTWLSPWWVKYANQIWMSGGDYGFSHVPSFSQRDAAMTYRDIVLYQDFKVHDLWMPIANLMTHGIIKGSLQMLGGEQEPIDKFTNNALFYFARGVSMWELYISPDILSDAEWSAISQSLHWAKENFNVLKHTEMVGGNPGIKQAYGYIHFNGKKGIIAARNPFIERKQLHVKLAEQYNLDPRARNLVLERIYPDHRIDTRLYGTGDSITLNLDGYETAVYEMYPLQDASEPLLAGVDFDVVSRAGKTLRIKVYPSITESTEPGVKILNPKWVNSFSVNGKNAKIDHLSLNLSSKEAAVTDYDLKEEHSGTLLSHFTVSPIIRDGQISLLLQKNKSSKEADTLQVKMTVDQKDVTPRIKHQRGDWAWYTTDIQPGRHRLQVSVKATGWQGKISLWLIGFQKMKTKEVRIVSSRELKDRPLPAQPWPAGTRKIHYKLGELSVNLP